MPWCSLPGLLLAALWATISNALTGVLGNTPGKVWPSSSGSQVSSSRGALQCRGSEGDLEERRAHLIRQSLYTL